MLHKLLMHLHMAFAGGGISRITLSPDLIESDSYTASFNYDGPDLCQSLSYSRTISYEFANVFSSPQGSDEVGQLFEKQMGWCYCARCNF